MTSVDRRAGSDETARLTVWVRGRVQGVGMRWSIRARALELGLTGWARNTDDGRVEVVAEGSRAGLDSLLTALESRTGFPGRIDGVTSRWSTAKGDTRGFTQR